MPLGDTKEYKVGVKFGVDNSEFTQKIGSMTTMIKGFAATVVAAFTIQKIVGFIREVTAAANEEERAITELNAAMKSAGDYNELNSAKLKSYAAELQRTIGISDDVVISNMAMLKALGHLSNEALPGAEKAVIGLSQILKIDLDSAAKMVAKTLTGNINILARSGIQIDMTASKEDKLNQILKATAAGYMMAEDKANTYEGAQTKLNLAWDDMLETIGGWITKSPVVIEVFNVLNKCVTDLTNYFNKASTEGQDFAGVMAKAIGNAAIYTARLIISLDRDISSLMATYYNFLSWRAGIRVAFNEKFGTKSLEDIERFRQEGKDADAALLATGQHLEMIDTVTDSLIKTQGDLANIIGDEVTPKTYTASQTFADFSKSIDNAAKSSDKASGSFAKMMDALAQTPFGQELIHRFMEPAVRERRTGFQPYLYGGENLPGIIQVPESFNYPGGRKRPRFGFKEGFTWESRSSDWGGEAEITRYIDTFFKTVSDIFQSSLYDLGKELGKTGKIGNTISEIFNQLGDYIGQEISKAITKSWNWGGDIFGPVIGGFLGGIISTIGGGGGGGRGSSPSNVVYTFVTNFDQFYKLGTSMPTSFIMSGRANQFGVDPHGRVFDYAMTGYRNRSFLDY